jgi:hypothetical protein
VSRTTLRLPSADQAPATSSAKVVFPLPLWLRAEWVRTAGFDFDSLGPGFTAYLRYQGVLPPLARPARREEVCRFWPLSGTGCANNAASLTRRSTLLIVDFPPVRANGYATQMPDTATFWNRCGEATAEDG